MDSLAGDVSECAEDLGREEPRMLLADAMQLVRRMAILAMGKTMDAIIFTGYQYEM